MQHAVYIRYALLAVLAVIVLLGLAAQVLTAIRHGDRETDELNRVQERWRECASWVFFVYIFCGFGLLFVKACWPDRAAS